MLTPDPAPRPWGHEYQDMLGRESLGSDTFCSGAGREAVIFPSPKLDLCRLKVEHKTFHTSTKSADLTHRPLHPEYCPEPRRHLSNPAHHRCFLLSRSVILGATRWARRRERRRKGNSANEFRRERHFKHSEWRENSRVS